MNKLYSVLNTVQAASSGIPQDYKAVGGNVIITGLEPFLKQQWIKLDTAPASSYRITSGSSQQGFYTLDTTADITTSGTVIDFTSSTNPDTFEGEVLTVIRNSTGLVYYAIIAVGSTGTTATVAGWFGANGTPANVNGAYTVVRQGYAFTKVVFADITSKNVSVGTTITSADSGSPLRLQQFEYTVATTATKAVQATAYYNTINASLNANGYAAVNDGVDTVYVMHPPNTILTIVGASTTTFASPTITEYATVSRTGYGADIIPTFPTATSTTIADQIVATSFYDMQTFTISDGKNTFYYMLYTNITVSYTHLTLPTKLL
jgi:hypothetical protein